MAITLQKLTKRAGGTYKMRLIAGQNGMTNLVEWVHLVEDKEVSQFLNGNELIFTTGLWNHKDGDFMEFVDSLYDNEASGLVVNLGPFIKDIPKYITDYCDEKAFPLFIIPWEIHLVDVTRDFCRDIANTEQNEASVTGIFKDVIAGVGSVDEQIPLLERRGFHVGSTYTIIIISNRNHETKAELNPNLKFYVEKIASKYVDTFTTFSYSNNRVLILQDYPQEKTRALIEELERRYLSPSEDEYLTAVGPEEQGLGHLADTYRKVHSMLPLCEKKQDGIAYYEELGAMKILLDVHDIHILEAFYNEVMRPLEDYDRENDTEYVDFLRKYLESNGNIQRLADSMYVHRNTINYQIRKIKSITGRDLSELKAKFEFILCFQIKELF
ncbi:MAG: PucR family transcriptional regulator [Clostridia bacterium]|nr:PucR family transcriptional regulator [Clostridia bacterium]NCD01554.1 PucR family transcriptional regulator [Clostridia bacterium]